MSRAIAAHDLLVMIIITGGVTVLPLAAIRWWPGFRRGKRITEL